MRIITITIEESACGFDVHENGKCCGGLSWDEMLGQVAMLTMPAHLLRNGFAMKTPEQWEADRKARQQLFSKDSDTNVTTAPAIVFYPAGSLGEAVDSEGIDNGAEGQIKEAA